MPTQLLQSQTQLPAGASSLSGNAKVSASALLKMEEHLGKDALDDSNDHNIMFDDDLLPGLYSELGQTLPPRRNYQQYPVYTPKSSSEYFSVRNSMPNPMNVSGDYRVGF